MNVQRMMLQILQARFSRPVVLMALGGDRGSVPGDLLAEDAFSTTDPSFAVARTAGEVVGCPSAPLAA